MAGPGPDISVVVPTFRRPDRLARLVASFEAQTLPSDRFELVVVDNGSGDETTDVLTELAAATPIAVRPLRIDVNHGPGPARNLGWQKAAAPLVAYTDDDCVPAPDWLERGLTALQLHPEVGVVQGATLMADGHRPSGGWDVDREILAPSPWFEGCNLFFRREALQAGGGFDETILFGGEDTVAGWSVLESGWERLFEEQAVVRHDVEYRDFEWHLRMAWRERNLVAVAVAHPRFRDEGLWRRWAAHPKAARFAVCAAGLAFAPRWPAALVLTLPWLRRNVVRSARPDAIALTAGRFAVDLTRFVAMTTAALQHRRFIL